MNEAEKLLEKFARKNMVRWNQESFKRTHSRLHKSIIEALNEALRIHDDMPALQYSDDMCFHECPYCSFRCNCSDQPCSCCNEA